MLFAKSQYTVNGKPIIKSLAEHCREVMDSFEALFGTAEAPTRLAQAWRRFFKLDDAGFQQFYSTGVVTCGLHDVGKANDGFQALVGNGNGTQVIRHEHLSGLLLALPNTMKWMRSLHNVDADIVLSSVIAHHLKAESKMFAQNLSTGRDVFCLHSEDAEFQAIFRQVSERVRGSDFIPKVEKVWSLDDGDGFDGGQTRETVCGLFSQLNRTLYENKEKTPTARHRLLMAVRAAVILADAAGSGLPRNNLPIDEWIRRQFPKDEPITAEYIQEKIIAPRIAQIERKSGSTFTPKDFQTAASGLSERALMLASCGSGKTMAAWFWIQSQLKRRTVSRVIFLYPTRATATEGFKDYVSWAPEADAALLSGTAAYELEGMFDQPSDERCGKDFTVEERLYSLAFWQKRIFSATVDQFLGFMQHVYGSVCLLPVLADAVVVFDEVHSFDPKLFSTLKQFLKNFDVPALCMTASLPKRRREELSSLGLEIFPGADRFPELDDLAGHPRYRVVTLNSENEAMDVAIRAFESGKRVLWVVNTVERCQRIAKKLNALCYHSCFVLKDRKCRHDEVVAAFQQADRPAIAVTTQVCEMSLDLDADALISECAPITALIQRLGRCNRNAKVGEGKRGEAYLYAPESNSPYAESDMEGVNAFIAEIAGGGDISQSKLEALLEDLGPKFREKDALCRFLADGCWATSEPLRDIDDYRVTAVLDYDVEEYITLKKDKKPSNGLLISIPKKFGVQDWRLGKHILRAPSSHYKAEYGFSKTPYAVIC